MSEANEIIYLDRFNKVIEDVLWDKNERVYVPLDRVTGVRKMFRKRGQLNEDEYSRNPNNYNEVFQNGDAALNDSEERSFNQKSYPRNFNQQPKRFPYKKQQEHRGFPKSGYQKQERKTSEFTNEEENWGDEQERTVSKDLTVKVGTPEKPDKFERKPSQQPEAKTEKPTRPLRSPIRPKENVEKLDEPKPLRSPRSLTQSEANDESVEKKPFQSLQSLRRAAKFDKPVDPQPKQPPKSVKSPGKQPEAKVEYKQIELSSTEFQTVHVSYRVDDRNAWVFLDEFSAKINDWVSGFSEGAKNLEKITDVKVGNYCFCFLEDVWCRVVIIKTEPKILVRNIDFGFVEEMDASDLYKIPQAFRDIPRMSILINLIDGAPSPITDDTTNLRVKAVEKITDGYKVHVEFGIYEKKLESILKKPKSGAIPKVSPDSGAVPKRQPFKKEPELVNTMFSKLESGSCGIMTPYEFLSETKFIASFCPDNMMGEIEELAQMATDCPAVPSFSPKRGDMVAGEYEGEGWCRAVLLETKNDEHKIAFVDYGQLAHVAEVRPVPKQFRNFPWFSCVCTCSRETVKKFSKGDDAMFVVKSLAASNASIEIRTEDFSAEGKIEPWYPVDKPKKSDGSDDIVLELCSGDRVQILCEADGYLYLRTKRGSDLLKTVEELMRKSSESLSNLTCEPKVGQLVAGEYEGDWYRAVVEMVKNGKVLIEFIDYGNTEQVSWKALKLLNGDMKQVPFTLCKVKLKGFSSFSKEALEHLSELSEMKTVMTVTFDGTIENGVELITRSGANLTDVLRKFNTPTTVSISPLSKILNKLRKKTDMKPFRVPGKGDRRVLMTDVNFQDVKYGRQKIRILEIINAPLGLFTFCLDGEDVVKGIRKELSADIQYYVNNLSKFDPSYKPETNEVVLAKSDGLWRRAYVSEVTPEDDYEIFLSDDGRFDTVTVDRIRRISPDFTSRECLASLGVVSGFPARCGAKAEAVLRNLLAPETVIDVTIKDTNEERTDMYTIEIPHIIRALQRSHLL